MLIGTLRMLISERGIAMPATGKSFHTVGITIDRIIEGKIAERVEVSDVLGMLQQLGLAPAI